MNITEDEIELLENVLRVLDEEYEIHEMPIDYPNPDGLAILIEKIKKENKKEKK